MKKRIGIIFILGMTLLFAACATGGNTTGVGNGKSVVENAEPEKDGQQAASNREIIAALEQTVTETPKRDAVAREQIESDEYKKGLFGKPSPELEEDMAVQAIEVFVAIDAVEEVYGGHDGFQKEGVLFIENQTSGADQSGVWIGIKEPDERLDQLLALLQPKVDAGEILAEPIYIYRSAHTGRELQTLQIEVGEALKPMKTERGTYGHSVDTITGDIEITHDFLKDEKQEELREKFADHVIHFKQNGKMVAEPGEPTTTYPDQEFTTKPSKEGAYVMDIGEEGMLIVDTMPMDFSSTGGVNNFYSAIHFKYPEAAEKLKVGQRVHVEPSGFIAESYPGQGRAKYVEVLPEYKPENSILSESEVVVKAIAQKKSNGMLIVRSLTYDEKAAKWKVGVKQEEEYELEIEDK